MKKVLLMAVSFIVFGCYEPEPYVPPTPNNYYYEVTGSSNDFSVTIQNAYDDTQQWNSVSSGWKYNWTQTGRRWLYVSAQNNKSTGNVTVSIYMDGKLLKTNTSYGGYTIATVDGNF